ncbi:ankyrin repeat domain-containing protein [Pseudomonas sp.]|uniref:ankyrin repeat domain-containing protein n=1 Tax=Pseudomonas sp. TaxID=306 RepID=UPI00273358A5|nr:ankyrin repeat domain-containing protein [Pseudomonas sp.]MDP3815666.1 ankyrin repeat domain-containing protein [Pseudomonas sp.]
MKLHECAQAGDIAGMGRELTQGARIDALDRDGLSALMRAAASPAASVAAIGFLLERGADVRQAGKRRAPPALIHAVRAGSVEKVAVLLDAGADITEALSCAVFSVRAALPMIELLLARGADIETVNHAELGPSPLLSASRVGRFEVIRLLLATGADPQPLAWTALMQAIAWGSLADVQAQLSAGVDLTARDSWQRTPWLLALQTASVAKAELLLSSGADRRDQGRCGKQPLMYALGEDTGMLLWLIEQGFDLEAQDEFGKTALAEAVSYSEVASVKTLLQAGAQFDREIIASARTREVASVLLEYGARLDDLDFTVRSQIIGCRGDRRVRVDEADYRAAKHRRFGTSNPELFDEAFWLGMVDCRAGAWEPRLKFDGKDRDEDGEAVWCFERFGCSVSRLADGRYIEIAGEHEDFYDPDFCIYNDVVVHDGHGDISIYGYPRDLFPPTDFHSATVVGDYIYIIGCLGYPNDRIPGYTPVFRLHCSTLVIEKIETSGQNPGWIYQHKACALGESAIRIAAGEVVGAQGEEVPNMHAYLLDLTTLTWTCSS